MAREFAKKFYRSKNWKQCRESYITSVNMLCEKCWESHIVRKGYIVHHKIPLTPKNINDVSITLSHSNLQFLCLDCHNRVHGDQGITVEGLEFDENGNLKERN